MMHRQFDFGAKGTAAAAGDGRRDTAAAVPAPAHEAISITLPASVALILRLVTDAKGVTADEAIARGICIYAGQVGIPTLARESEQYLDDVNQPAERAEFGSGGP